MKSYFQTTDRHGILSILSKSISPDFLNCVSKNQEGKIIKTNKQTNQKKKKREESRESKKALPVMLSEFLSKGADSWLNPKESDLDRR